MGRVGMGRVCQGPSLSWAEFVMGRDVPESTEEEDRNDLEIGKWRRPWKIPTQNFLTKDLLLLDYCSKLLTCKYPSSTLLCFHLSNEAEFFLFFLQTILAPPMQLLRLLCKQKKQNPDQKGGPEPPLENFDHELSVN